VCKGSVCEQFVFIRCVMMPIVSPSMFNGCSVSARCIWLLRLPSSLVVRSWYYMWAKDAIPSRGSFRARAVRDAEASGGSVDKPERCTHAGTWRDVRDVVQEMANSHSRIPYKRGLKLCVRKTMLILRVCRLRLSTHGADLETNTCTYPAFSSPTSILRKILMLTAQRPSRAVSRQRSLRVLCWNWLRPGPAP
jgi:hypothetical protein